MILRIINSFAFTRIAFICWYWYTQNILNLTHLQTNLLLHIYISGTILRLAKSDCVFHPLVWFFHPGWVLSDTKHLLFGVTIGLKQLKVLGVLCSLCKVTGDLGFLNYNQIYLLGINKTYSPPYKWHLKKCRMDNRIYISQLSTSLFFHKLLFKVKKIDVRLNKTLEIKVYIDDFW